MVVKPSTANLQVRLYQTTGGQFVTISIEGSGEEVSFHRTDWPTLKALVEEILKRNDPNHKVLH
jgi:hypothetical protein